MPFPPLSAPERRAPRGPRVTEKKKKTTPEEAEAQRLQEEMEKRKAVLRGAMKHKGVPGHSASSPAIVSDSPIRMGE